jgi:uncharacterized protein (DUF2147 family)/predicted aspartyl protease
VSNFPTTLIFTAQVVAFLTTSAAKAGDVTGEWMRDDGAAKVQFSACGDDAVCGFLAWKKDTNGPAKIGEQVFDMKPNGADAWAGTAFNPADGKQYIGKMALSGDHLTTSGCVFGGLICKFFGWSRARGIQGSSVGKEDKADISTALPARQMGGKRNSAIPLDKEGDSFLVPVAINGELTLKFTIDSGASDVSIPADVVLTLLRTGTLTHDDFLGTKTYRLADGSTIPSQTFQIRSLKVGDRFLTNVTGSVAPVTGSLLLGQSFLSSFRTWSIDNQRQVLLLGQ